MRKPGWPTCPMMATGCFCDEVVKVSGVQAWAVLCVRAWRCAEGYKKNKKKKVSFRGMRDGVEVIFCFSAPSVMCAGEKKQALSSGPAF